MNERGPARTGPQSATTARNVTTGGGRLDRAAELRYRDRRTFLGELARYWGTYDGAIIDAADGTYSIAACCACRSKSRPESDGPLRRYPLIVADNPYDPGFTIAAGCGCPQARIVAELVRSELGRLDQELAELAQTA